MKIVKSAPDPIFVEYAKTAPLEDLRFYLRAARSLLARFDLKPATLDIIAEMTALEADLAGRPQEAKNKAVVWTLLSRYKSSIPNWPGQAGAPGSWFDADDVPVTTFGILAELNTDQKNGKSLPAVLARFALDNERAEQVADAMHRPKVDARLQPLSEAEVDDLLQPRLSLIAPPVVVLAAKAPSWKDRALKAEAEVARLTNLLYQPVSSRRKVAA